MTETDPAEVVTIERRGRALWIWINREKRRNAMNKAVIAGIHTALDGLESMPDVRAVVLTGVGRRAFCSGVDLSVGTGTFTLGLDEPMTDFGKLARKARQVGVPLIARINGDCVAGGMGLMAMCDLAIVADHARFGLPEGKVGVFPMQVLVFLRGLIGARHVNELCLTGELITAARGYELGLVNSVVPAEALDARVDTLVETLGGMSPVALKRGKHAIAAMETMAFSEALAFAETAISLTSMTADATEGLAAFNEKRKPRWAKES